VCRFVALAVLAALTVCAGCAKKPPDDKALAQGEWAVASIELPDELKNDEEGAGQMKDVSIVVRGDRVTITHPKDDTGVSVTITLDPAKTPKEFDAGAAALTSKDGKEQPEPGAVRGIYKFEGDELVIAVTRGRGHDLPRPTKFVPSVDKEKSHAVLVFHLKRK
jgi:uncharacterized protein (TIGR03067 family)